MYTSAHAPSSDLEFTSRDPAGRKRHPSVNKALLAILTLVALIFLIDLTLPLILSGYVNRVLNRDPAYSGRLERITVNIWRGAYTLHNLEIKKSSGRIATPLFASPAVDLSVEWRSLLNGAFVGEIEIDKPVLSFVSGPDRARTQNGEGVSWTGVARDLFPLKINRLAIESGQIHYLDPFAEPKVDIYLQDVNVKAKNLTTSHSVSKSLWAELSASAKGKTSGTLIVEAKLDPHAQRPTFDLAFDLKKLALKELNTFLLAYASFDVKNGSIDVYSELTARNGEISGYVKPLAHDVEIIDLKRDSENPLRLIWEGIVATLTQVFTNHSKDQVASKIPISGIIDDPETGTFSAIGSLLRNAFIEALKPGVDGELKKNQ